MEKQAFFNHNITTPYDYKLKTVQCTMAQKMKNKKIFPRKSGCTLTLVAVSR